MYLPTYPNGRDIEINDRHYIAPILREYPSEISDYNFTNIFAWRHAYRYKISQLDGMIINEGVYKGRRILLPPIGHPSKCADIVYHIFEINGAGKEAPLIEAVPEWLAGELRVKYRIKTTKNRNDWDYIYQSSDLSELPGQKYHAKRNLVRQFTSKYGVRIEGLDAPTSSEAIEFSDRWCKQRDCESDEGLQSERCAIYQMLTHFEALNLEGILLRIDGDIVGLAIGEELTPDTFVIHAEKGDHNFKGIYQFLNQQLAIRVAPRYKWINREQDLGVDGLRRAKTSYHPHHFIEKFRVEHSM